MEHVGRLVNAILRSPQIKNKAVVLCEGDLPPDEFRRLSPQNYAKCERLPDANFYKASVPRRWHNSRTPAFFNCGGRAEVLDTYEALREKHAKAPTNSYLDPEKLYALVDLDIQMKNLPDGYPWKNTEEIHEALYVDGALKLPVDDRHRIWVTALVHKEAFFLLPSMSTALVHGVRPFWKEKPLDLRAMHAALAGTLGEVRDICERFDIVKARMHRYAAGSRLACTDAATMGQSWLMLANSANDDDYEALSRALLAVAKAKTVWEEIVPDPAYAKEAMMTSTPERAAELQKWQKVRAENFRDQLALKIAAAISVLEPNAHPLAGFFAWLEPRR